MSYGDNKVDEKKRSTISTNQELFIKTTELLSNTIKVMQLLASPQPDNRVSNTRQYHNVITRRLTKINNVSNHIFERICKSTDKKEVNKRKKKDIKHSSTVPLLESISIVCPERDQKSKKRKGAAPLAYDVTSLKKSKFVIDRKRVSNTKIIPVKPPEKPPDVIVLDHIPQKSSKNSSIKMLKKANNYVTCVENDISIISHKPATQDVIIIDDVTEQNLPPAKNKLNENEKKMQNCSTVEITRLFKEGDGRQSAKQSSENEVLVISPEPITIGIIVIDDNVSQSMSPTKTNVINKSSGVKNYSTVEVNGLNDRDIRLSNNASPDSICKYCLNSFSNVSNAHELSLHKTTCSKNFDSDLCTVDLFEEKSNHPCPCCSQVLVSSHHLRNHLNNCHMRKFPVCTCHCCKKHFSSFAKLEKHLSMSKNCQLECKKCHKQYRCIRSLRSHITVEHRGKGGYFCSICKKIFPIKLNLDIHISLRHKDNRPHKCPKCKKGYAHRQILAKHLKHSACSGKTFQCNVCGKIYPSYYSLKTHLKSCHKYDIRQYKAYLKVQNHNY